MPTPSATVKRSSYEVGASDSLTEIELGEDGTLPGHYWLYFFNICSIKKLYSATITKYYLNGMNRHTKKSGSYEFVSLSNQKDGIVGVLLKILLAVLVVHA